MNATSASSTANCRSAPEEPGEITCLISTPIPTADERVSILATSPVTTTRAARLDEFEVRWFCQCAAGKP